jgi:manganese-dependent inorganic pyrophosphatase
MYVGAQFVTFGKLFSYIFSTNVTVMVVLVGFTVTFYTLLGGFRAVGKTDLTQGLLMAGSLVMVFVFGFYHAGGIAGISENLKNFPRFTDFFGIAVPENVTSVAGKTVALVDFNEESQGPSDIKDANIIFIADHHRLGGLTTAAPIEIWMQPLGSVNTLLYEIHTLKNVDIPKNLSGAMLCAILSDTLVFTSPTTTARDKFAAEILSKISGINDIEALGKDLMKIKSDVSRVSAEELVNRDYKDYVMNGKKVGIGQIEVMGLDEVEKRKAEFFAIIEKIRIDNGYHSVYLMLTDIMNHGTKILISSSDPSTITKAFGKQPEGNEIWLEGVVSRKSQVVPKLEKAFE